MNYIALLNMKSELLAQLDYLIREAEVNAGNENKGALDIQRAFRGSISRGKINFKHATVTVICRVFRGHTQRKRVKKLKRQRTEKQNSMLFHCYALILQKYFRGYYSRKYRSNHFKRMQFIQDLASKSEEIRKAQVRIC